MILLHRFIIFSWSTLRHQYRAKLVKRESGLETQSLMHRVVDLLFPGQSEEFLTTAF